MTTKGRPAWNQGIKFPHSPEWESKRLAATRLAASKKVWPKGYKRPKQHTDPMRKALDVVRQKHPEKFRDLAIANLPKDCDGSKNGNWKGGITAKTRGIRFSKEYKSWRSEVLKRDGYKCRKCGTRERLHAHHIVSMAECGLLATVRMNGLTLCKKCHYEIDLVWQGRRPRKIEFSGNPLFLTWSIPHKWQEYPTVGNWQFTKAGLLVIFVSDLNDWKYESLILIHELCEALMCRHDGVTQQAVDDFDKAYEAARPEGDESEPGDDPKAPYVKQHCIATGIERIMAAQLGVNWNQYADKIESLP